MLMPISEEVSERIRGEEASGEAAPELRLALGIRLTLRARVADRVQHFKKLGKGLSEELPGDGSHRVMSKV